MLQTRFIDGNENMIVPAIANYRVVKGPKKVARFMSDCVYYLARWYYLRI